MLHQFFNRVYGSTLILKQLPAQRKIAFSSPEKIHQERDKRVRSIVRYAAHYVPYYQTMFSANRIDYRDIRTAADLDQLPLLSKQMVRDNPDLFISTSPQGKSSVPFITSGSTGSPLRIHHDINSIISNVAYCEPEKQIIRQYVGRKKNTKNLSIIYSGSTMRKIWGVYSKHTFLKSPDERNMLFVEKSFDELIKKINVLKPDVINGYGSHFEALFKYAFAHDIKLHYPAILNYGADSMTQVGKKEIKDKTGTAIFSRYSAVECFRIGYTCERDEGFHIHENLCDLKIVGPNGDRLSDGEPGEVVISNLVNRGTVLLNYKLGDIAVKSPHQCSCGRNHSLLTNLVGRLNDFICMPDGGKVDPRLIWNVFKSLSGVVRYQLIQHKYTKFELKIVTKEYAIYEQILPVVLDRLRDLLGNIEIISDYYDHIDTTSNGKFRPVVSYCKK